MTVSVEKIKNLREKTGVSLSQCRAALLASDGDLEKALAVLREQGAELAAKKSSRLAKRGLVSAYVHAGGALGALVELNCETDFVAKNSDFITLAEDLAMHITAFEPQDRGALLAQPFLKEPSLTVAELLKQQIQKFGENIAVARFSRFAVGEAVN